MPLILMIGYVWPETNASAAGLRDWALLEQFRAAGWKVHYASPAKPNAFSEKLEELGVPTFSCEANEPRFDDFVRSLQPDFVLFDRFVIEEQFGWRVEENCPDAVRVTDTQDLHFLRRAREAALAAGWSLERIHEADPLMIEQFSREDQLREISSIYRSDLTLVISGFEMQLLRERYRVPSQLLLLQRLSYSARPTEEILPFSERKQFRLHRKFPPSPQCRRGQMAEARNLARDPEPHSGCRNPSYTALILPRNDGPFRFQARIPRSRSRRRPV